MHNYQARNSRTCVYCPIGFGILDTSYIDGIAQGLLRRQARVRVRRRVDAPGAQESSSRPIRRWDNRPPCGRPPSGRSLGRPARRSTIVKLGGKGVNG